MTAKQTPYEFHRTLINDLLQRMREDMRPEHVAILDALVLLELTKRAEVNLDLKLEMRLVAERHRPRTPYLAHCLRALADLLALPADAANVVPLSKPSQEQPHAPKRH